jgi:hypothetical protein
MDYVWVIWVIYGLYMGYVWVIYGLYGLYMGYIWVIYGLCMGYVCITVEREDTEVAAATRQRQQTRVRYGLAPGDTQLL